MRTSLVALVMVLALTATATATLTNYYAMNDGSGTVVTDSVGGMNGATGITADGILGDTGWVAGQDVYHTHNISGGTPGHPDTDNYILIDGSVGSDEALTVAMWLKTPDEVLPEGNPKDWYMRPLQKQEDDASGGGYSWGIRPGGVFRVYVGSNLNNQSVSANGAVQYGVWQHYAMTFAGGTLNMYVDGALVATGAIDPSRTTATAALLQLGGPRVGGITNQPYNGYFSDVKIYDEALDLAGIQGAMVPEPVTMVLLGIGGLLLRRRSR